MIPSWTHTGISVKCVDAAEMLQEAVNGVLMDQVIAGCFLLLGLGVYTRQVSQVIQRSWAGLD